MMTPTHDHRFDELAHLNHRISRAPDWLTPTVQTLLARSLGDKWGDSHAGLWLTVDDIEYVAARTIDGVQSQEFLHGSMTMPIRPTDDAVTRPPRHWVVWNGKHPRTACGKPMTFITAKGLRILRPAGWVRPALEDYTPLEWARSLKTVPELRRGLVQNIDLVSRDIFILSLDPPGGYLNHVRKVGKYVGIVRLQAKRLRESR
ncbi:MAG: hypothetical protein OXH68_01100 [Gammaproteobacteria bacterium]|nr:hypothetical protein [Gammaproteobacteria bacterium]